MEYTCILNIKDTTHYKNNFDVGGTIKQIQTSNPGKIILVQKYQCRDCSTLERILHNIFKSCKLEGEWFNFDDDKLEECKNAVENLRIKIHNKLDKNTCKVCNFSTYKNENYEKHKQSNSHKLKIGEINEYQYINKNIGDYNRYIENKCNKCKKIFKLKGD